MSINLFSHYLFIWFFLYFLPLSLSVCLKSSPVTATSRRCLFISSLIIFSLSFFFIFFLFPFLFVIRVHRSLQQVGDVSSSFLSLSFHFLFIFFFLIFFLFPFLCVSRVHRPLLQVGDVSLSFLSSSFDFFIFFSL